MMNSGAVVRNLIVGVAAAMLLAGCGSSVARYNNRGNEAFAQGDYVAALDEYRQAQQEDPDVSAPYYNSGNTYHQEGKIDSAITQLKQANRTAEGELAQHSNYNLGNSYFKAEDFAGAIEAYKQALRLNPADTDAKYNLELALKQQQQQQQQQQGGGGGGGQPPPPDQNQQGGGGQGDQNQDQGGGQNGDQPQGGGQPKPDEQGQGGGGQGQQSGGGGSRGLTPQEAQQLLDALGQDSQTLQERLQEGYFAPGMPPAKDW